MAKSIALNLTINGVKQSITSINDLEKAIKDAEDRLKGIAIGSEEFKNLQAQIRQAKGTLEDFQESVKGKDFEKRIGAFAKVGESIVSSFAAAQATLALFGAESEDVAKAAAKAQAVLTIALTARSVAEGLVQVKTVAQTIATYASAAAANAANSATKALWATLAANPIGAIIAVVGLLVTALIALSDSTQEQVNVQKELASVTSDEADALKESLRILTTLNDRREVQKRTIEDLKKTYPGFNAFIDKENKLNADGIRFLTLKIKQYQIEANVKALLQKISENNIKILEIENSSLADQVGFWETVWDTIKSGGDISAAALANYKTAINNQKAAVAEVNKITKVYTAELDKQYTALNQNYVELEGLEKILKTTKEAEDKKAESAKNAAARQTELNDAYKKGFTSIISFKEQIDKLNEAYKRYNDTVNALDQIKIDAKIIEDLKKVKEARVEAAKTLNNAVEDIKKNILEIQKIPQDVFLNKFLQFRTTLEQAFTKPQESIQKYSDLYQKFITDNKDLTQEQITIINDLVRGYRDVETLIKTTPGFSEIVKNLKATNLAWTENVQATADGYGELFPFLALLGDVAAASGTFKLEIDDVTGAIKELKFDPVKAKKNAEDTYNTIKQALFIPITKDLLKQKKEALEFQIKFKTGTEKAALEGQLKRVQQAITDFEKTGQIDLKIIDPKEIEANINAIIGNFDKLLNSTIKVEQSVLSVNLEVEKLTKNLVNAPEELSKAIGGVLKANIDEISKLLLGVRTREQRKEQEFVNRIKNDRAGLEKFKADLIKQGVDVEKASYDDLLAAYIEYKRAETEVTKQAEEDQKKIREENLREISTAIQTFSDIIQGFSQVNQQRISADLEALEIAQKQALEGVVGNSEEAAKKRLEIEKEYEQKKKEIEKQGRLTSLKFSLVQTIANGAQAVVKALAEGGPILGPILAAINAGLALAQVAIINDQIATTQSLRRGGRIKKMGDGGILVGPSHEQGGIPLQYGGVIAEGNEAIINRQSTLDYRDLLSSINMANGGRPMVVNTFDDSRIVEVLSKQNQTPIRAYVLESEITNNQAISKRLDDLSKF